MLKHKYRTVSVPPLGYDIKSLLTESVIESHLKVDYESESAYLDALVGAAWDRVEKHLGVHYAEHVMYWESYDFASEFTLPVDAERVTGVSVDLWDGSAYVNATDERLSNIGYPTCVSLDTNDTAWQNITTEDATIMMRAEVSVREETPPPAVQQAFLLYLGYLYEKREAVITGAVATEMPRAYEYLLNSYRKQNGRY